MFPMALPDLSYNNIEKIEGLETLTKLEDLSFYNNKISCIENLDTLHNLTFLGMGNNCLDQLDNVKNITFIDLLQVMGFNHQTWPRLIIHAYCIYILIPQVIYLRRFKNLHTLNLAGNPVAQEENYKLFIAAYLSDLAYLDYRLLNGETVSSQCCGALVYAG